MIGCRCTAARSFPPLRWAWERGSSSSTSRACWPSGRRSTRRRPARQDPERPVRANTRVMRRVFLAALLLLLPVAFPGALRAQDIACDPGDLEVRAVTFDGNKHFESAELASVIVTSASSFTRRHLHLPIGARRCLDTLELSRDAVRIRLFYRLRGYYKTAVKTSVKPAGTGAVAVGFGITEGPPVIIDSLAVTGLDSVSDRDRLLHELDHFRHNHIFTKIELQAVLDTVLQELHDNGLSVRRVAARIERRQSDHRSRAARSISSSSSFAGSRRRFRRGSRTSPASSTTSRPAGTPRRSTRVPCGGCSPSRWATSSARRISCAASAISISSRRTATSTSRSRPTACSPTTARSPCSSDSTRER